MFRKSKLRGPVGRIYPIFFLCVYILLIIEIFSRKYFIREGYFIPHGPIFTLICTASFFVIMGIYQLIKYKSWVFLILGLLIANSSIHGLASFHVGPFNAPSYFISLLITILFIVIAWPFLYGHERHESNARRLFKLASDALVETGDGFTSRPYFAGKIDYPEEKIQGFARFLKAKYITKPVYRERGVYLLFSMGISIMKNVEPEQVSYVLFDKSGQMSVHISAFDYKQYTQRFTFDQLCDSFGKVFNRFLQYYLEGNETRISVELKSV